MTITDLSALGAAAFTAGGLVYMVKRMKRDVNGIGKRLTENLKRENARHTNVNIAILCIVPEDKKEKIAELLREEV